MCKKSLRPRAMLEQFENRVALAADFAANFSVDPTFAGEAIESSMAYEEAANWDGSSIADAAEPFDVVPFFDSLSSEEFEGAKERWSELESLVKPYDSELYWQAEYHLDWDVVGERGGEAQGFEFSQNFEGPGIFDLEWSLERVEDFAIPDVLFPSDLLALEAFVAPELDDFDFPTDSSFANLGHDVDSDTELPQGTSFEATMIPQGVSFVGNLGQGDTPINSEIEMQFWDWIALTSGPDAEIEELEWSPGDDSEMIDFDERLPFFEEEIFDPEFAFVSNGDGIEHGDFDTSQVGGFEFFEDVILDLISTLPEDLSPEFSLDVRETLPTEKGLASGEVRFEITETATEFEPPSESVFRSEDSRSNPQPDSFGAAELAERARIDLQSIELALNWAPLTTSLETEALRRAPLSEAISLETAGQFDAHAVQNEQAGLAQQKPASSDGPVVSEVQAADRMSDELRELAKGLTHSLLAGVRNEDSLDWPGHEADEASRRIDASNLDFRTVVTGITGLSSVYSTQGDMMVFVGAPIERMYGIDTFDVFDAVVTETDQDGIHEPNEELREKGVAVYESAALMIGIPVAGVSYAARLWRRREVARESSRSGNENADEPTVLAVVQSGN